MTKFKGIDVSAWQGEIDWDSVKKDGVEFAIIRTGYGRHSETQIDKYFKANIKGAKTAGIKVGVYHYSYAESVDDAKTEAEFCLSILDGEKLDLPVYYDIEDKTIAAKHDKDIRTNMCIAFCSEIENAGYWAGVYANKNWYDNFLNYEELKKRYTLWLAHYGIDEPSLECDVWQYTSSGAVEGINGNVDMNFMYRDLPAEIGAGDEEEKPKEENKKPAEHLGTYTVVSGDTLGEIAAKHKTTYQHLAEINGLADPNLIYPGQVLKVPSNYEASKYTLYTVESGDSLWGIAQKILGDGARYNEIKAFNGLDSDTIYPGQVLKIK